MDTTFEKARLRAARGVALLLLVSACAAVAPAAAAREPVRLVTLGNGLEVLLAPDSLAQMVDVGLWFDAGVRTEPEGRSGLTYVLGRMQFLGAPQASERTDRIEAAGGIPGSSIFADFSGTSATVPPAVFEQALELQAGRLAAIPVTDASLRAEVAAVREERARRIESNPVGRGLERLYASAFSGHPYARPVIGRDADLVKLTVAEAKAYAGRRLDARHGLLTIVGRFDPEAALAQVRTRIGAVGPATARAKDPATPAARRVPRASIVAPARNRLLIAGWSFPGRNTPDAAAAAVLARLLFGAGGWVERGVATPEGPILQAQGELDLRREASLLYAVTVVADDADTAAAENRLIETLEGVAGRTLDEADLDRARRQAEAAILFPMQGTHGRAVALASAHLTAGGWDRWEREIEAIRGVTAADLQRVATRLLVPANRSVVWVFPAETEGTP